MERDEEAEKLWADLYYQRAEHEGEGVIAASVERGDAIMLRLSMIYALSCRSRIIQSKHVQAAFAIWKYVQNSARYSFGARLGNSRAEKIFEALRRTPRGMTRGEIKPGDTESRRASRRVGRLGGS